MQPNGKAIDDYSTGVDMVLAAMDLLPMGFLILSRSRRILAANRAARLALKETGVIAESCGTLVISSTPQDRKIRVLLERQAQPAGSPIAVRVCRPSQRPVLLLFIPIGCTKTTREDLNAPAAMLYVADLERSQPPDPRVLAQMFDFSPAECRVAALFMEGVSVDEVATRLRLTENTVRNHLKRLFHKTGTGRQAELVHLLLSSPTRLRIAEERPPRVSHMEHERPELGRAWQAVALCRPSS